MLKHLSAAMASSVVAAAMLTGVAPSAEAADDPSRVVLEDGTGDVWTGDFDGNGDPVRAGDFPAADVTQAVIKHDLHALRIRMRIADLQDNRTQFFDVQIRTPRRSFLAFVSASPSQRQGSNDFESERGGGCRLMTHTLDYTNDIVTMRIPRRCLGRPRWVRVNLLNALILPKREIFFVDNPHNDQAFSERATRRLYRAVPAA